LTYSHGRKKNNSFFKYDLHEWVTYSTSPFFKGRVCRALRAKARGISCLVIFRKSHLNVFFFSDLLTEIPLAISQAFSHSPFKKGRSGVSDSRLNSNNTEVARFLPTMTILTYANNRK